MNNSNIGHFPKYFTSKAIAAYFAVLTICLVVFPNKLPLLWITFGAFEVVAFFYFSNLYTRHWTSMPDRLFQKRLFYSSLILRLFYIVIIFFFYQSMTGQPFEFSAGDSSGYHGEGMYIIDLLKSGHFTDYFTKYQKSFSDRGFPLWLSAIYLFTGNSIMIARIVIAVFSAWMCVLIYRLAFRTFGLQAARITAVMSMLMPSFIYYAGLHTKETFMVFLLVAFAERADYMLRSPRIKPGVLLIVVFLGASLFLFRTVLGVAAWFSLFSALLFSARRMVGARRRTIYIGWFVIAALVIISGTILNEVESYSDTSSNNLQKQMQNFTDRKEGNKFSKYGTRSIFLPMMLVAPFPTMVNVEEQENAMMINGNVFVHNVYAFFVLIALWSIYKKKLITYNVLLLTLLSSYLFILASSGFALSERFHVPVIPFLLILAGYGVTQLNKRNASLYVPYLVLIAVVILGWNWFKLAGRGIL
jgi:4-amino-4-deoxy-L-arabinose transferase-like glycosyltransferase